jgi:hypothetical protein
MGVGEPPVGVEPAIGPQRLAIGLAADAERLNALDDVWSAYLAAEPSAADIERDMPELTALVDDMATLLERLGPQCRELRGIIRDLPIDLDHELRQAVLLHPFGEQYLDLLPESPFAEQVVNSCSIVEEDAPREIDALRAKLQHLKDHGYSPGDIGRRMKCAILLAGQGAAVVGTALTPVSLPAGLVIGVVGGLVGMLASAKGWDCKKAGDLATAT